MLDARKDIRRFSDYDFAFHAAIARMTGNTILIRCYSVILQCLKEYFDQVVERIGVDKGSFYHGEILAAMEKRDAGLAGTGCGSIWPVTASGFFAITEQEREQGRSVRPDSSAGLSAAEASAVLKHKEAQIQCKQAIQTKAAPDLREACGPEGLERMEL